MVGTDKPAFEDLASRAVDGVTIHFAVPEDVVAFTREVFVLCMDVEGVGLELGSTQFAAKILTIHPKPELIGIRGLVSHAVQHHGTYAQCRQQPAQSVAQGL